MNQNAVYIRKAAPRKWVVFWRLAGEKQEPPHDNEDTREFDDELAAWQYASWLYQNLRDVVGILPLRARYKK